MGHSSPLTLLYLVSLCTTNLYCKTYSTEGPSAVCSMTQRCINRGMCSHPELTLDHVLTSAYVIIFWAVARNAVNKSVWRKKTVLDFPSTNMQWISLFKHQQMWACRRRSHLEHGSPRPRAQCSDKQSTVLWEPEHTGAPCSPRAPNLLYVPPAWIVGFNYSCSPAQNNCKIKSYFSGFAAWALFFKKKDYFPVHGKLTYVWRKEEEKNCPNFPHIKCHLWWHLSV